VLLYPIYPWVIHTRCPSSRTGIQLAQRPLLRFVLTPSPKQDPRWTDVRPVFPSFFFPFPYVYRVDCALLPAPLLRHFHPVRLELGPSCFCRHHTSLCDSPACRAVSVLSSDSSGSIIHNSTFPPPALSSGTTGRDNQWRFIDCFFSLPPLLFASLPYIHIPGGFPAVYPGLQSSPFGNFASFPHHSVCISHHSLLLLFSGS